MDLQDLRTKKVFISSHPLTNIELLKTNIFRIQANNSTMCRYFCIGFFDFMFSGKTLIDYTSFFSPYDFKK